MILITPETLTVYAVSDDKPTRYAMHGLRADPQGIVATDGKTMAVHLLDHERFEPFTIDPSSVARIKALVSARGSAVLDPDKRTIDGEAIVLAEGHYPPWAEVMPKVQDDPKVDVRQLAGVCKGLLAWGVECARFSTDSQGALSVEARTDGCIDLRATFFGVTEDAHVPTCAFNPAVLLRQCQALGKRLGARARWPRRRGEPLVVSAQGYVGVVMPLAIQ